MGFQTRQVTSHTSNATLRKKEHLGWDVFRLWLLPYGVILKRTFGCQRCCVLVPVQQCLCLKMSKVEACTCLLRPHHCHSIRSVGTCLDILTAGGRTRLFALFAPTSLLVVPNVARLEWRDLESASEMLHHIITGASSTFKSKLPPSSAFQFDRFILVNHRWSQGRHGLELEKDGIRLTPELFLGGSRTSTYSPPGDYVHSVGFGFSCSPMGSSRWCLAFISDSPQILCESGMLQHIVVLSHIIYIQIKRSHMKYWWPKCPISLPILDTWEIPLHLCACPAYLVFLTHQLSSHRDICKVICTGAVFLQAIEKYSLQKQQHAACYLLVFFSCILQETVISPISFLSICAPTRNDSCSWGFLVRPGLSVFDRTCGASRLADGSEDVCFAGLRMQTTGWSTSVPW